MRLDRISIVPLDSIPDPPYETPKDDLTEVYRVSKAMEQVCVSQRGMGLAASQVGIPWRMFVFWSNYPDPKMKFDCLVDCSYKPVGDDVFSSLEGCLSLPGERYRVRRHESVAVEGLKLVDNSEVVRLEPFNSVFSGVMSVLVQHEMDHDFGREKMIDSIGQRVCAL
jgi:peptide deformylase